MSESGGLDFQFKPNIYPKEVKARAVFFNLIAELKIT
jgi:hypothetical protein